MKPIPSLTYMDGETVSQLAARVSREIESLEEKHEADMALDTPTYEHSERLAYLLGVAGSLRHVVSFLSGEHAAFHETARRVFRDSGREVFNTP